MSTTMYRRSILCATLMLASMASRPALAQDPTDLPLDFLFKGIHEKELQYHQARLQDDINRGDSAGVNRDLNRIQRDEWRLWYDRRRIRRDMWLPAGPWVHGPRSIAPAETLVAHPQYPGYGYYPSHPTELYLIAQPATSPNSGAANGPLQFPIVIVNAGQPGTVVDFVINGVAYQTKAGEHQRLALSPGSTILFTRGDNLQQTRYSLSSGVYEFQTSDGGWALFKLKPPPEDANRSLSVVVPKNDLPATTGAR